jgi:hypothetical protein
VPQLFPSGIIARRHTSPLHRQFINYIFQEAWVIDKGTARTPIDDWRPNDVLQSSPSSSASLFLLDAPSCHMPIFTVEALPFVYHAFGMCLAC